MVQQLLRDYFDGKEQSKGVNLDEVVTFGAAVRGSMLSGKGGDETKGSNGGSSCFCWSVPRRSSQGWSIHYTFCFCNPLAMGLDATCVYTGSGFCFGLEHFAFMIKQGPRVLKIYLL